ncbi:hypothetical protein Q1695_014794 [Nippostrongylus brasiliensis]|nr:hypothetical protein Q1695_014794 [Nippostrongylus brasiliensis]
MATKAKRRTTRRRRMSETYEEPEDPLPAAATAASPGGAAAPAGTSASGSASTGEAPAAAAAAPAAGASAPPPGRRSSARRRALPAAVESHLDAFVDTYTGIGVEGLKKQFKDGLSNYRAPDDKYKFPSFTAHPTKNRYQDIVCLEDTRVKLTLNVPPATDYIHANWVKFEGHDKVFIATQAPIDETIEDFWRMVFQEGCPHIVNLTKIMEDGKVKCTQYWPLEAGEYKTFGKMFVNTKKVENEGPFRIYTVEVLPEGFSNSNIVKLLHMKSWPDRGLPMSGRHVLRLIRQVTCDRLANGPIVMHCSAGVGRTGTIILIDLVDMFKQLRNQRAACIQQDGQYVFVVLSVLDYLKIRCPKYKEKVGKFMDDFRNSLPQGDS